MEVGNQEESIFGEGSWFAMNEPCPSPSGDSLGEVCLSLYAWLERALHKTTSRTCYGKTVAGGHSPQDSDSQAKGGETIGLAALMVESRLPALDSLVGVTVSLV